MSKIDPFVPMAPMSHLDIKAFNKMGTGLNQIHTCLEEFKTENLANQSLILNALRIAPESKPHTSIFTMSRAGAGWRLASVVFAGIMVTSLILFLYITPESQHVLEGTIR